MKNGKRIVAVLVMAIGLTSLLPLLVSARTEQRVDVGLATFTPSIRYSKSGGGWMSASGYGTYVIPIPIDQSGDLVIENIGFRESTSVYVLDTNYAFVAEPTSHKYSTYYEITFPAGVSYGGYFIALTATNETIVSTIQVNGYDVEALVGNYTEAIPSSYYNVEVDDPIDNVNDVLGFWQEALGALVSQATPMYNELAMPIALIAGVPASIALIALIIRRIK